MGESESDTLTEKNLYQILGVEKEAELDDIRKAYKRLALRYHPDKNAGDPVAAEKFKEISKAANLLSDPTKRALYDRYGDAGISMAHQFEGEHLKKIARILLLPRWAVITSCIVTCCYCFGFFGCCCCCCCCFGCFCNHCCGKCKKSSSEDDEDEEAGPDDFPDEYVMNDRNSEKVQSREQPPVIDNQPETPNFALSGDPH